jgi:hypothetical protein
VAAAHRQAQSARFDGLFEAAAHRFPDLAPPQAADLVVRTLLPEPAGAERPQATAGQLTARRRWLITVVMPSPRMLTP